MSLDQRDRPDAATTDDVRGRAPGAVLAAGLRTPLALVAVVCAVATLALGLAVGATSAPTATDSWVAAWLDARFAREGVVWWTILTAGDPVPAAVLVAALTVVAHRVAGRPMAVTALAGAVLTGLVTTVAKPLVGRTINDGNLCFPSGHTAAITALGLTVGIMAVRTRRWGRWRAVLMILACGVVPGCVVAVHLVTGVIHYPTDTLGGLTTAVALVFTVAIVLDRRAGVTGAATDPSGERGPGRVVCAEAEYPPALLAVAGYGLPGAFRSFPDAALNDTSWSALVAAAEHNRLTGWLYQAAADGALPTTASQLAHARAVHRGKVLRMLAVERELVTALTLLEAAGIGCRVLKGTAVATLDYPDRAMRSFVDMDILVRADDIGRVVQVMGAAGYHRTLAEPRPDFDRRFDKGMTLMTPAGFELDLHRTFVLGPWGFRVDLDALWHDSTAFAVGGHPARALCRPMRLVHACYHAALGDWPLRLGSLRDVLEILARLQRPDEVREIAEAWGVQAVVAAAVADAHRLLGVSSSAPLVRWAHTYRPRPRECRWLALHTREDKTFSAQALATLIVLPRWRDKAAYLHALLRPVAAYTEGRHTGAATRFWYAMNQIRKGTARNGETGRR